MEIATSKWRISEFSEGVARKKLYKLLCKRTSL